MENSNSRHGRHRTGDSLPSTLGRKISGLKKETARLEKLYLKLYILKAKLISIITTIKLLEQQVERRKNRLQRSISRLSAAIENADMAAQEEMAIRQARASIQYAQRVIHDLEAEQESSARNSIQLGVSHSIQLVISSNAAPANRSEIVDVDLSEVLEQKRG